MLKTCEALVQYEARTPKRLANHWRVPINGKDGIAYGYHNTIICEVNLKNKTFQTSYGGWFTRSTKHAVNSYIRLLEARGYKHVGEVGYIR